MGDQLSRLQEKDDAGEGDHGKGDPLDGVEETCVRVGLAEEGEEELRCTGDGEGEGEGVAGMMAAWELAQEDYGENDRYNCGVEGDRMKADVIGRDAKAPGEGGGETGVAAFGEVAESEEGPGERGAGRPGVQCVEEWEIADAEIDCGREDGEEDAGGVERRHHQQKDGVGEEVVQVGDDEQETGESEGGEESEEAGVPEPFRIEADDGSSAKAEGEGGHESDGGEDAEGGKQEMSGVEEVGVHLEL
jgi:hypothetical protein